MRRVPALGFDEDEAAGASRRELSRILREAPPTS